MLTFLVSFRFFSSFLYHSSPLTPPLQFAFCSFNYHSQPRPGKIKWKIPETKQFISFRSHAILGRVMKSQAFLLCPVQD